MDKNFSYNQPQPNGNGNIRGNFSSPIFMPMSQPPDLSEPYRSPVYQTFPDQSYYNYYAPNPQQYLDQYSQQLPPAANFDYQYDYLWDSIHTLMVEVENDTTVNSLEMTLSHYNGQCTYQPSPTGSYLITVRFPNSQSVRAAYNQINDHTLNGEIIHFTIPPNSNHFSNTNPTASSTSTNNTTNSNTNNGTGNISSSSDIYYPEYSRSMSESGLYMLQQQQHNQQHQLFNNNTSGTTPVSPAKCPSPIGPKKSDYPNYNGNSAVSPTLHPEPINTTVETKPEPPPPAAPPAPWSNSLSLFANVGKNESENSDTDNDSYDSNNNNINAHHKISKSRAQSEPVVSFAATVSGKSKVTKPKTSTTNTSSNKPPTIPKQQQQQQQHQQNYTNNSNNNYHNSNSTHNNNNNYHKNKSNDRIGSMTASGRIRTAHSELNLDSYTLDLERVEDGTDTRTTLMVRNIPNKYKPKMLLAEIDVNYKGKYDFFYLPIDFKNRCNVGYAFINFIDSRTIAPFCREFNDRKWKRYNSDKICEVRYGRIQGQLDLISHFRNSSVMTVEEEYRPLLFNTDGVPQQFPAEFYNPKARRNNK